MNNFRSLNKSLKFLSAEAGLLCYIAKLPRMHLDPNLISYGIWPSDSSVVGGKKYSGRSSGCGYEWENAILSTIGEVIERYCPAFYDTNTFIKSSYKNLQKPAIHPNEIAMFHESQYGGQNFPFVRFQEETEIHWAPCIDLATGAEVYFPASLIYMPYEEIEEWVGLTTSTGLAGHTDIYKAILNGLYEVIERDNFVMMWMNEIFLSKIIIDDEINAFLKENYNDQYEFHFFDITFDLPSPTVFGICFGKADYGDFVAVGSASRGTFGEAMKKVIMEIGQAVSYFRFMLGEQKDWMPNDFYDLIDFEKHSTFYLKRKDLWSAFDRWRLAEPSKKIDFNEEPKPSAQKEIQSIIKELTSKGYNVLLKYLTTPDVEEAGFHSVKVIVPQLLELSGSYSFYFCGGKRLYTVPEQFGFKNREFSQLNKNPHPFP